MTNWDLNERWLNSVPVILLTARMILFRLLEIIREVFMAWNGLVIDFALFCLH